MRLSYVSGKYFLYMSKTGTIRGLLTYDFVEISSASVIFAACMLSNFTDLPSEASDYDVSIVFVSFSGFSGPFSDFISNSGVDSCNSWPC